ncbi:MAG: prepilin-type N-terminal cleavage/methylation domain-containing protein [Methylococcales bacterium]|nr:prepilin-type N-terminal cleavage/methylation domain-containing protein [Methylococcales bacterium]
MRYKQSNLYFGLNRAHQTGITLIELIISMMVISIALTGILTVMNLTVKHSADPVIYRQSLAIAESYLEEILLQPYTDPNGIDGETNRTLLDDVDDYNGLTDTGVHDQQDNVISTLVDYDVTVSVSAPLALVGGVLAKKVTVNVSGLGASLNLVGYKADY